LATAVVAVASPLIAACHWFDSTGSHSSAHTVAWHVDAVGGGTPGFDGSSVYFIGGDHSVSAFNATTGAPLWKSSTGSSGGQPTTGSCVVSDALVVCGDGGVIAFRRGDGSQQWRFDGAGDHPGIFPLRANNGRIFAGSSGHGTIYALDAVTGSVMWTASTLSAEPSGANVPSLAVDSDIVVGTFLTGANPISGGVIAVDANTGSTRWVTHFPQGAPDSSSGGYSVALWENSVMGSSLDGKVFVLDRSTGTIESFFPGVGQRGNVVGITGPVGLDFRPIVVSNSVLFAGSTGNWLVAYDLNAHRELWRALSPRGSFDGSALVTDGNEIYGLIGFGYLTAFSATRPNADWSIGDSNSPMFTTSFAVSGDAVFGAGTSGFWAIRR
jgi:outer membrane protein assembly factor BamB